MAQRAPANEWLRHLAHLDRGHNARGRALAFDRIREGERVDHGRQHPHVVSGRPIDTPGAGREATEDVPAADDHSGFDAKRLDLRNLLGDLISGDRVDPERLFTHQGFAGELEEDAAIGGFGHGRKGL